MVDPTSDLGEDVTEEDAATCDTCGDSIVQESTHRVVSWVDGGQIRHAHFCDEVCRDEWENPTA